MWYGLRKITLLAGLILFNVLLVGCTRDSAGSDDPVEAPGSKAQATDSQATPQPAPVQIVIDNFTFSPAEVTIPAGTKVTWVNHDDVPHTATSSAKPRQFSSKTLDTDEEFSFVFTAPGAYEYFCALHPKMTARITVK